MTDRDIYLPVAAQPSVSTLVGLSQLAEAEGYERVWLPETWGRDAVTTLTSIADGTDEVGIGTSLLNVYSRSPSLIGQTAATLQEASGGRLRVGLGPSGLRVIEGWHGESFERPLRRTRETIDVVKQVLSGETVAYDGDIFELSGFRLRCDPPDPAPPIDAGGLGPKAVELAGRFADGWHALLVTADGMADRLDDFERGVELGGRDRASQRVTFSVPCCALDDRERARQLTRQHIAFYVGGMGTYYRDALARQGYEETATTVFEGWNAGEREAAVAAVDDDLLDALAVAGTPEECRDRLARFEGIDGVDAINVSFPRAAQRADIEATMAALAP
ncbi:TIGR04024 family LLM class F420-dependent oxidoreductase [Haloarcula onubensis]|uniref:TIGR04024 family LLM class F420-dependent oxidoreductase n=1 Tax=Haloarcula onubensis TaxID=2950539 RepID=A0ABU2FL73_9EURY|nr:TIGR04024 family LLM class F420-dependent oxidoreductase [Halomicroarcula sp. S3CR25-11]MDS0281504.1 TIGR04024 family LLM class F420-dependent oxidoreductase [Halomicroarcula sp. S3CR25-11]